MRAHKRKKDPESADALETDETTGTHETAGATETNQQTTPAPRTPVEVFDDMIERRRHTTPQANDKDDPGLAWEQHRPDQDDERRFGRIRGFQRQGGSLAPTNNHRGRLSSWVTVLLACAGFVVGGLGLVMGVSVVLLVIGGVLLLVAAVVALVFDMMSDVVLDSPRMESEEPHGTPLHRIKTEGPRKRPE